MSTWYSASTPEEQGRILSAWADAPVHNAEVLGFILSTSREQVAGFARESDLPVPSTTGQLVQGSPAIARRNAAPLPQPTVALGWIPNNGSLTPRSYDPAGGRRPNTGAMTAMRAATSPSTMLGDAYGAGISTWSNAGRIPCQPGETWTASAYSKANVPYQTFIALTFYNAAGVATARVTSNTIVGAAFEWTRPWVTGVAPANTTTVGISRQEIDTIGGALSTGTERTWMTDALYEQGSVLGDWFDGTLGTRTGSDGLEYSYAFEGPTGMTPSVETFKPWLFVPDPPEVIDRLVYAQLCQARNLYTAGTVRSGGEYGDDQFSYQPRPLDKTIRSIIRPIDGTPHVL